MKKALSFLLIPYEVESYAIGSLAQKITETGHQAFIANADSYSFIHQPALLDYYKKLHLKNTFNFKKEFEFFQKNYQEKDIHVDWHYLNEFERKYCKNKNIQQIIMSDTVLNPCFRFPYYTPLKFSNQLYHWIEVLLKWSEDIFNKTNPDYILTFSNNYLIKNIFNQIAQSKNCKMLTLASTRIENYFIFCDHFGLGSTPSFLKRIQSITSTPDADRYIAEYIKPSGMESTYNWSLASTIEKDKKNPVFKKIFTYLKSTQLSIRLIIAQFIRSKRYRSFMRSNFFESSNFRPYLYLMRREFNTFKYKIGLGFKFAKSPPALPYIYFPLHVIPESSTLTLSTEYYEDDLIRFLSKELPSGIRLVVKEHPGMIPDRPVEFFKNLRNLQNVVFIDPFYSSKELIKNSHGVCGISGTSLLEGAILEKQTLAFGDPEFIDVLEHKGHAEVPIFFKKCQNNTPVEKKSLVHKYIQDIFNNGVRLDWTTLLYNPNSALFHQEIDKVFNFLLKHLK